jgi:preprotein translocase subunit SecA
MFVELMESIKNEVLNNLFRSTTNLQAFEQLLASMPRHLMQRDLLEPNQEGGRPSAAFFPPAGLAEADQGFEQAMQQKPVQRVQKAVGRNDPCPCGSGKKYKSCCGRTA